MLNSGDTVRNYREKVGLITLHCNLYVDAAEFGITRTAKFFCPLFQLLLSTNFDPHAREYSQLSFLKFIFFGFLVFAVSGRLKRMARAYALHSMIDYLNIQNLIVQLSKT